MTVRIKNCGMQTLDAIEKAAQTGAAFIGFIHYPKSKRYVAFEDAAALAKDAPQGVSTVAVMVNPTDEEIQNAAYADYIQLHGDETPERVAQVKALTHQPVIKALGIADPFDLARIPEYEAVADMLLLDTKHSDYGGTGTSFDWSLLTGVVFGKPWLLSGGLDAGNVTSALALTRAPIVDVSSGIEREPGVKDLSKIEQFNKAVKNYAGE